MDIVPVVKAGPIDSVASVGDVVLHGNQRAIVRPAAGQPPVVQLAAYDPQTHRFMNAQAQPGDEALAFKGEYVLEPDPQSATTGNFGPGATDELFFDGSTPLLVLHVPAGNTWRALNLSSGIAASGVAGARPCFKRWKLGVRGADGEPKWLFSIG